MESLSHTICAISTPAGTGGIAVVRVSGDEAFDCVQKCWNGAPIAGMKSHTAHLGKILFENGETLDEVVLTIFRAPHSFTGENVAEIACHGSVWVQQQIVHRLVDCGCRIAAPGEFTRRAFSKGRIDLSQAEAIADVIAANSRAAHRIAMSQMRGDFSRTLSQLREKLLNFVALMELELDFSEEEVEFADRAKLIALAENISDVVARLASSFSTGNAIKNGVPVAIVGETNVGKSSLLNTLLHDDKALVSNVHGTTRDVIEDTITIEGQLFRFIDTAGIRETTDTVESMGIERTFHKLSQAAIVLWVIDATQNSDEISKTYAKISALCSDKKLICVANKCDLINSPTPLQLPCSNVVQISAKTGIGIETLQREILAAAQIPEADENQVIVTNARHYQALTAALAALQRALAALRTNLSGDLISQDIREAIHYLGEITGEITPSDILTTIFSHFCVGK